MPAFKKLSSAQRMGPPEKISLEIISKIVNNLRVGATIETAAVCAGISKQTLYTWFKNAHAEKKASDAVVEGGGKRPKPTLYVNLLDSVERAIEECEIRDLYVIDKAANGSPAEYLRDKDGELERDGNGNPIQSKPASRPDWSAAAWRLERRKHLKWARKDTTNVKTEDVSKPKVVVMIPSNGREAPKK